MHDLRSGMIHTWKIIKMCPWIPLNQLRKVFLLVPIVICAKPRFNMQIEPPPPLRNAAEIDAAFREHEVIPDLLSKAPKYTLEVAFHREYYVDFGNYIVPAAWEQKPTKIHFAEAKKGSMYVLIMTGLDFPTRKRPRGREWWYWVFGDLVGGPGLGRKGKTVMAYIGPSEMKIYSGMHRIVFLLMEQLDGRVIYDRKHLMAMAVPRKKIRSRHNTTEFMKKYNLTGPIAGNFFTSGYNYPRRLTPAPRAASY